MESRGENICRMNRRMGAKMPASPWGVGGYGFRIMQTAADISTYTYIHIDSWARTVYAAIHKLQLFSKSYFLKLLLLIVDSYFLLTADKFYF